MCIRFFVWLRSPIHTTLRDCFGLRQMASLFDKVADFDKFCPNFTNFIRILTINYKVWTICWQIRCEINQKFKFNTKGVEKFSLNFEKNRKTVTSIQISYTYDINWRLFSALERHIYKFAENKAIHYPHFTDGKEIFDNFAWALEEIRVWHDFGISVKMLPKKSVRAAKSAKKVLRYMFQICQKMTSE